MFGRDEKPSPTRLTAVQYIILGVFLLLAYGLWKLQVSESSMYASLAEQNRIRNVPILAPRGKIIDRSGRTIVDNYRSVTALLLRDSSRDLSADADLMASGLSTEEIATKMFVAPVTVRTHIRAIIKKLRVPDREAAIRLSRGES